MIERYSTPEMRETWSDEMKWARWRQVELWVLEARGIEVSEQTATTRPSAGWVQEMEREVGHDFVAWLRVWTSGMPTEDARQVHHGLTSSDVVDTALGLTVLQAGKLIDEAAVELTQALSVHGHLHRPTIRAGRTHGIPAEVSSWGLWTSDVAGMGFRGIQTHRTAFRAAGVCKISGPVGTYAEHGRDLEERVARALGLIPATRSTQVVARDRIANWASSMVRLLGICERFATEVRLGALHGELEEGRLQDQIGSSAMPHKRNPVTAEKICGLARLGRGYLIPILESVALWHERDISHSSVERVALPDLAAITEYALIQTRELVEGLVVRDEVMRSNVHRDYVDLCKHWALCRMVEQGVDRWEAHRALQPLTMAAELEALAGQALPAPEWFLRNA